MRVINRTAITLVGAKPYLDWTRQKEAAWAAVDVDGFLDGTQ